MVKNQKEGYNVRLVDILYNQIPAFTDLFDEETFYNFVICFVIGTVVLAFMLSRFITLKPVDW